MGSSDGPPSDKKDSIIPKIMEDGKNLSFDFAAFNEENFDVDKFLRAARRHGTLQKVHGDLRTFLQKLQYAMVVLINDDYTDFVKLSSTLASLKDGIVALTNENSEAWKEYAGQIEAIQTISSTVTTKVNELEACRGEQLICMCQKTVLTNIQTILSMADKPNDLDPQLLARLRELVTDTKLHFDKLPEGEFKEKLKSQVDYAFKEVVPLVLPFCSASADGDPDTALMAFTILRTMGVLDIGLQYLSRNIISTQFDEDDQVEVRLDFLIKTINDHIDALDLRVADDNVSDYARVVFPPIYRYALLNYFKNTVKELLSGEYIPSSTEPFKSCYTKVFNFVKDFDDDESLAEVKKDVLGIFNVDAYIRLHCGDDINRFHNIADSKVVAIEGDPPRLTAISEYLKAFEKVLSYPEMLPATTSEHWSLCNSLDNDIVLWSRNFVDAISGEETSIDGKPKWQVLVIAAKCLSFVFEEHFRIGATYFTEISDHVVTKLNRAESEAPFLSLYGRYNSRYEMQLTSIFKDLLPMLETAVVSAISEPLKLVTEVPRQYRWTRTPHPTTCSDYVNGVDTYLKTIYDLALTCYWTDEEIVGFLRSCFEKALTVYTENAETVIATIEKTADSMSRYKNRQTTNTGRYDSDEVKMREQIRIDTATLVRFMDDYPYCNITNTEHPIFNLTAQFQSD
uniref:Conserved oligomeric Golgi complex subunit 2 n=1 Tax=Panagrellus redivivus TaxID=6233 RepID=A0A7E4ZUZ1_PANRE